MVENEEEVGDKVMNERGEKYEEEKHEEEEKKEEEEG